jgi:ribosomal protein S8E
MRKCSGGRRRQGRAVRRFKLENQRHNREANQVDRQLTLCHIMANNAVVRVVIAGLRNVSRDG